MYPKTIISIITITIMSSINGCYIINQSIGQITILSNSQNIEQVLNDKNTNPKTKKKIILVKQVKYFAKHTVGLNTNDSYNKYIKLKSKYVAYNLSAAHPHKLKPIYWYFPIIGKVPYLGFFKKKDAIKQKNILSKQNLDTLLRGVKAYSTLGFFQDPLFSSIAELNEPALINTLIHEMTHSTIFLKNYTAFNESLASFVANKATITFIKKMKNKQHKWIQNINNYNLDKNIFSKFIDKLKNTLTKLYENKQLSKNEKINKRYNIFSKYKNIFKKQIKPKLKTNTYLFFENIKLNNAVILSFKRYNSSIPILEKLFKLLNNNMKNTILFIKKIPPNQNPNQFIIKWIKQNKKEEK